MSHILEFLGQHARVYTLDEYLQQCLPPRIASFVKQYEDPPAYLDLLRSTYIVCEEPLGRAPRDTYAFAGTAAVPVSEVGSIAPARDDECEFCNTYVVACNSTQHMRILLYTTFDLMPRRRP